MSQHHRATRHTTKAPRIRAQLTAQLPLPCVDCRRPVFPGDAWQVGHILAASQGGQTTIANCGPSHTSCNRRAGGKLGAAVTNAKRRSTEPDIRTW